jgi:hypothetical protein
MAQLGSVQATFEGGKPGYDNTQTSTGPDASSSNAAFGVKHAVQLAATTLAGSGRAVQPASPLAEAGVATSVA